MTFKKMSKQIILGTAGHIDHGKTALIKALTGTDTDRLKEEKLRGITIVLGFASLDLPDGQHIGIVDVPGHEKFVKNMVAGATGIDIVALIIAADDGIMPQTREHLEICDLLDISHGLVAVTKVDLVDKEWLELVIDDIQQFLKGTFLEDAPIIPVSSITGQGIPDILAALEKLSGKVQGRSPDGLFRLPVDRVFTIKGFGTVVTGTLISGKLSVGDNVMIYSAGIESKVRGIQVHNEAAETATAGLRTAINFQGLDKSVINRGAVVAAPNTLRPTYMVDVWLRYLKSAEKPLRNRTKIRFHTGTSEVLGYVVLVDREEILPGEDAIAQCRLNSPVVVMKDDRFVIRSYSPIHTVGGGRIIDPVPQKHKRGKTTARDMQPLVDGEVESIVNYHMTKSGLAGLTLTDLIIMTNQTEKQLTQTLQHLLSAKRIVLLDRENQVYMNGVTFENLKGITKDILKVYHEKNPLKGGMSKEELKSKLPGGANSKLFNLLVQDMVKDGVIVQAKDTMRLATHQVALERDQSKIRQELEEAYLRGDLQPPYFKELVNVVSGSSKTATDVLFHMVEEGVLIKVKDDLYFHKTAIERLKDELVAYLKVHTEITTPQFKAMTETSRKYTIPLLEYFDAIKLTIRIGDSRRLRER
jgi:selenocysteine-specific elongation factor